MNTRIGIQGEIGSACDAAAREIIENELFAGAELEYLTTAERTLGALSQGQVDMAVIALESPCGEPVSETVEALGLHSKVEKIKQLDLEVRHCLMQRIEDEALPIRSVASHPVPLAKHADFLATKYPGIQRIEVADTGLAAQLLADGLLPLGTIVIAVPKAAEVFGLKIIQAELPANEGYLTRFVLVKAGENGLLNGVEKIRTESL